MIAGSAPFTKRYRFLFCQYAVSAVFFSLLIGTSVAYGGCEYDTQCKGDRICVDGVCVDPAAAPENANVITKQSETGTIKIYRPGPQEQQRSAPAQPGITEENTGAPAQDATEIRQEPRVVKVRSIPPEGMSVADTPVESESEPAEVIPKPGLWAFWINPLGFIQYGPTMGLEFRVAPNFYLGVHARYAAVGLMYNMLLNTRAQDDSYDVSIVEVDPKSFGSGLEFKYYITFPSSPNMLYVGMFGEYIRGGYTAFNETYNYTQNDRVMTGIYETLQHSVGMGITVGHRWRLGENRKVLLTMGIITGVARPITNTKKIFETGAEYDQPSENEFIIMAEIGIGYGM